MRRSWLPSVLLFLSGSACRGPCQNDLVSTVWSPVGSTKAVAFVRNCGATTGFSTHVSVLKPSSDLPNQAGNVLVIDDTTNSPGLPDYPPGPVLKVALRWAGPNQLIVTYSRRARVARAEKSLPSPSVSISYELTSQ